jgi:predicted amidohydrolase YtcJ
MVFAPSGDLTDDESNLSFYLLDQDDIIEVSFTQPVVATPDDRGFLINTLDDMHGWIASADEAGLHVMVHAIGDKAIADLLNIYLDVVEENGARDRRFRI